MISFRELPTPALARNHDEFLSMGFTVVEEFIERSAVARIRSSLDKAFRGDFDTGTYPDSWLWQEGTGRTDVPRQMVNAWKCRGEIAELVHAEPIARLVAYLMGWSSVRLAADSVWMKPPLWRPGGFHRDEMDIFTPSDLATCWVALDDVCEENGSLLYAAGTHLWPSDPRDDDGVNPGDRPKSSMQAIADRLGVPLSLHNVEAVAGSIAIHHGRTWHGSSRNGTSNWRSAIAIHLIRGDARFSKQRGGHVLGRYKKLGCSDLDDNFFPIVHASSGERSSYLRNYYATGERG